VTKHTPGPWTQHVDEHDSEPYGWIVGPNGEEVVSYAGCGSHMAQWGNPADLALALSAPDLLAALVDLYGQVDQAHDALCVDRSESMQEALRLTRAALAKATGGQ
jgi:hypothetical protein